jgi:MerR family transcriptional regulator, light-induced transcriptional regulator
MTRTKRSQADASELFPIRTVANLTGVNPVTLRAWERRHGLVEPVRTPSGHRLYGHEHIESIHRILGLLKKGLPISQVARAMSAPAQSSRGSEAGRWGALGERLVAATARFDEPELEHTYAAALALHPVEEVTNRLLLPVLRELGRRWQTGEGSVAEEHFFSVFVRDKLGARLHHRTRHERGPRILAACLPDEQHEIGLLVFALAAHERGLRIVLLAARTPLDELPTVARRAQCTAVVLSATLPPPRHVVSEQLTQLVSRAGMPVFVGGAASLRDRDSIVAAGAEVVGTDIPACVERIQSALVGVPQRTG